MESHRLSLVEARNGRDLENIMSVRTQSGTLGKEKRSWFVFLATVNLKSHDLKKGNDLFNKFKTDERPTKNLYEASFFVHFCRFHWFYF